MNQRLLSQTYGDGITKTFAVPQVPRNCLLAVRVIDNYVEYQFNEDHSLLTLVDPAPAERVLITFVAIPKTYALQP